MNKNSLVFKTEDDNEIYVGENYPAGTYITKVKLRTETMGEWICVIQHVKHKSNTTDLFIGVVTTIEVLHYDII